MALRRPHKGMKTGGGPISPSFRPPYRSTGQAPSRNPGAGDVDSRLRGKDRIAGTLSIFVGMGKRPGKGRLAIVASLAAAGVLALWAAPVDAQSPPVTAEVDRSSLALGETLTLTVSVNGSFNASQPSLPSLDGLVLVGRGSMTQLSTINGKVSGTVAHEFTFRATEVGSITIGPVSVVLDGKSYETDPIAIEVVPVSVQPQRAAPDEAPDDSPVEMVGQRRFVEASVDDPTPYLGGQVVYSVRYYQAAEPFELGHFFRVRPGRPNFAGFWDGQHTEERRYETEVAGRRYSVWEERTVVFPTVSGPLTIPSVKVAVPGGFFARDSDLRTQSVSLEVRPLPDGAPAGFTGAVGRYDVAASVDATSVRAGVPVTLTFTISGAGNIDAAPEPMWPEIPDWRFFDSAVDTSSRLDGGRVRGTRTYKRVMVPERAGSYTLPSIEYAYFDPVAGAYRSAATPPISIDVSPAPATAAALNGGADLSRSIDAPASDIRHIKPVSEPLGSGGVAYTSTPVYWALWALPLALLAVVEAWRRRVLRSRGDPAAARASLAYSRARSAVAAASSDRADPFEAGHRIMLIYVGDKLGQPVGGLTHSSLAHFLTRRGIEESLADRVNSWVLDSEAGRFGPRAGATDQPAAGDRLLEELVDLIGELERAFGR